MVVENNLIGYFEICRRRTTVSSAYDAISSDNAANPMVSGELNLVALNRFKMDNRFHPGAEKAVRAHIIRTIDASLEMTGRSDSQPYARPFEVCIHVSPVTQGLVAPIFSQ